MWHVIGINYGVNGVLMGFFSRLPANARFASFVILGAVLWMVTGLFGSDTVDDAGLPASTHTTVVLEALRPQAYTKTMTLIGTSAPYKQAHIAAQTEGRVEQLLADRGRVVTAGDVLLRIEMADRASNLAAAQATLEAERAKARAARKLFKEGFTAETRLAEQEAQLALAEQRLARIQQDITYTQVSTPLPGVVEDRFVDVGDYDDGGQPLPSQ